MKNIKLLPNIAGFGLAATTTITGIALEKLPITLTGINTGILVSAINFTNKKSQLQQQNDSASIVIDYLTKQIKTIQQETQQQQQQFNQYQQVIYDFKSQQSQTIQQHNYLGNQFNNLITNLENSNNNLQVLQKQQQQTIQEQKQLSFALGNAQNQLNSHNKKLKKQQHEINTHKTNQNKVTSELQKIKNQQKTMAATQTQHLGKIEAQVDTLIQIAQNISSQSVSPSKTTLQKKVTAPISRKPQTLSYIDNNNFFNCLKEMSIEPDYKSLLVYLSSKIGKTQIKLYDGAFS